MSQDLSNISSSSAEAISLPQLEWNTMIRLGLFQMGLGIMSVLTLGLLNRIMIKELGIVPTLVALILAVPYFVAPARVWFGQISDSKPILGMHRTGYVWLGALLLSGIAFLAVLGVWQLGNSFTAGSCAIESQGWQAIQAVISQPNCSQSRLWAGLLALIFGGYGLAISASSTPFAALLVDVTDDDNRPKVVGLVWAMLLFGVMLAAGGIFGALSKLTANAPPEVLQATINRLFIIIPGIVFALSVIATLGVEKRYSRYRFRSSLGDREDAITLGRAWKILTASRQTGFFFVFLIMMTLGLFMQDAILEAYGGEVFGMKIAETTLLNVFFGLGTILTMTTTGFLIVPRLGKPATTRLGCILVSICSLLLIGVGFSHNPKLLQLGMLLFGLASGIATTGAISLMLDLTAAETAGTFIGAWGLSQAWARGLATIAGGAVLDVGKTLFSDPLPAYCLVFVVESMAMIAAIALLSRVNVEEFITSAKQMITRVLETELD